MKIEVLQRQNFDMWTKSGEKMRVYLVRNTFTNKTGLMLVNDEKLDFEPHLLIKQ